MSRTLFLFCTGLLMISVSEIFPQEAEKRPAQIEILNADDGKGPYKGMSSDLMRLIGNVRLKHDDVLMQCDSAHRFRDSNIVHAFGNVHINQGDTLDLYGEYLVYNGNTKIAQVQRNVLMSDKETTLTTEHLDFDLANDFGYYPDGGVVRNGDNRLESTRGYYYTKEKLFMFRDSVVITNPDYIIKSDTLRYNTVTEVVYFLGPTTIIGDATNIYCENGWYNTQTDISRFYENARVANNNQILEADSMYYDNGQGIGRAFMNVEVTDTIERIIIKGNYAWFVREPEQMLVTDRALLIQMSDNDTMYMHADTLRSWLQITAHDSTSTVPAKNDTVALADDKDSSAIAAYIDTNTLTVNSDTGDLATDKVTTDLSAENEINTRAVNSNTIYLPADNDTTGSPEVPDTATVAAEISMRRNLLYPFDTIPRPGPVGASPVGLIDNGVNDTVRIMVAYYGVRFYGNEMQGKCDSVFFNMRDSVIFMFDEPVIWSGESQLTSEFMEIHSKNGEADRIIMKNSAFVVSEEEQGLYNQIKGKDILGYIRDSDLYRVDVSGNAETLYYPVDDEEIIGINKAASASLVIFLKESKPDRIRFLKQVEATMFPLDDVPETDRLLNNFQWLKDIRPVSREDVFRK